MTLGASRHRRRALMADLAPVLSPSASRNKRRVAARVATLDGAARGIPPLHATPVNGAAEPPWTLGSRAVKDRRLSLNERKNWEKGANG